jgi:hypothetical protein
MGELRTRAFLELALPIDVAVTASAGWGGDAYAVVRRGDRGPLAALWSTAWDDEAQAAGFAAALAKEFPPGASDLGAVSLRRQGTRVAWMRGIEDPIELGVLLDLPGDKLPDVPPCGDVILPSAQVAREILVPAGGDPHLVVPLLGLTARLPPRFASIRTASSDLTVQHVGRHGRGTLSHQAKRFDRSNFEAAATSIAPILAASMPIGKMKIEDVSLPIGPAKEARWPMVDGWGEARFLAVPFCGGEQTLFITTLARSEEATVALAEWVRSLEPEGAGVPQVCESHP